MSNVTQQTAWLLKQAGMPQPDPAPGQSWYGKRNAGFEAEPGSICILIGSDTGNLQFVSIDGVKNDNNKFFVFDPSLDYIAQFLPEGFILQMWDGRHSCKVETEDTTIRTQADSFAEAAALVYLELNKNQ